MESRIDIENSEHTKPGRPAVYTKVYEHLRNYLLENKLPVGRQIRSMADLCKQYGTSRTVVRKAVMKLQAEGLVTVQAGKGIFVANGEVPTPNNNSGVLTVSFITPAVDDPLPAAIHSGLAETLNRYDGRLLIQSADWVISRELDIVRQLPQSGVNGAVILPTSGESLKQEIASLCDEGWPIVLVDRAFEGIDTSFVGADHCQGAELAVKYLIDLGHHRIGMIKPADSSGERERFRGYSKALLNAGIPVDDDLVVQLGLQEGGIEPRMGGLAEMKQLLSLPCPPTAVFAGNDHLALGAFWAAQQAGLKVPEDISIIGFDALGVEKMVPGGITTVSQPGKQIGVEAGKLLMERISKRTNSSPCSIRQIRMPSELVPGATTGVAPKRRN